MSDEEKLSGSNITTTLFFECLIKFSMVLAKDIFLSCAYCWQKVRHVFAFVEFLCIALNNSEASL